MKYGFLRSDRLRVLVNGIHAKSGGGVTYLRNMMPLLAAFGDLELHLFIHRDQYPLFRDLDEHVRLHLLEYPNGFFASLVWEQLALPVLARVMSVDVTVSPANYGPLAAPAPVIVLRNSLAVVGRERRLMKRLYWAGLALMTAFSLLTCRRAIAVSRYARTALTFRLRGRVQEKVTVVYHGVGGIFSPGEAEQGRENFLLAVSDIYVQKNLHNLIQALAAVTREFPHITLKIAGRDIDRGYLEELKVRIRELRLEKSVVFLGECSTDQLLELYRSCQLFIFPSTIETFGNPLVEAMACGAPIASSDTAAMPEIVGDAARFFDPLDPHDMAAKIIDLLKDDAARNSLSARAIRRSRNYSWHATAEQTADIIRSVGADRVPEPATQDARTAP